MLVKFIEGTHPFNNARFLEHSPGVFEVQIAEKEHDKIWYLIESETAFGYATDTTAQDCPRLYMNPNFPGWKDRHYNWVDSTYFVVVPTSNNEEALGYLRKGDWMCS